MYFVYLLQSEKDKTFYIGFTSNLNQRLESHNEGKEKYTSKKIPWKIVYFEAYNSRKDAIARERKLKKYGRGIQEIKKRIINGSL